MKYLKICFLFVFIFFSKFYAQDVAILKYNGGGDWYANPTALTNLIEFTNKNSKTNISKNPQTVAVNSEDIYNFPIVFMTGHGNVYFSNEEAENLRNYLNYLQKIMNPQLILCNLNYFSSYYLSDRVTVLLSRQEWTDFTVDFTFFFSEARYFMLYILKIIRGITCYIESMLENI